MPVYKTKRMRCWRVRVWWKGKRKDWIVKGTKADARAFEARKRVEVETADPVEFRAAPTFLEFSSGPYQVHAAVELKASTWAVRRYQLASLIEQFGRLQLTDITTQEIEAYKFRRRKDGLKPISVNNELAVIQAVLAYARHLGVPTANPRIEPFTVRERGRLIVWSGDDVRRLLSECQRLSCELVPVVIFLANTGCRRGEALALRWECVDLVQRMIRIEPSAEWQPKGNRRREIPLSDELQNLLERLPRRSEYVFPSPRTGGRYATWPKRLFDRARKAAGLTGGPHTLRHTFASHFLKAVPDLFLLSRILGHSDARVTKLYAHLLPEHLAAARNAVRFAPPAATAVEKAASRWNVHLDAVSVGRKSNRQPRRS